MGKTQIKKGDRFQCIETIIMKGGVNKRIEYIKHRIYTSEIDGCITDENGNKDHKWPTEPEIKRYFKRIMSEETAQELLGIYQIENQQELLCDTPYKKCAMTNCRKYGCQDRLRDIASNKPPHYATGIDTFARMEANCTKEECLAFAKGNIDKLNWRTKGQDLEDLDKIIAYANWAKKLLTK